MPILMPAFKMPARATPKVASFVDPAADQAGLQFASEEMIAKRQALARALMEGGMGERKIEHPLQGAAQMSQVIMGGLVGNKAEADEKARASAAAEAMGGLIGDTSALGLDPQKLRQVMALNPALGQALLGKILESRMPKPPKDPQFGSVYTEGGEQPAWLTPGKPPEFVGGPKPKTPKDPTLTDLQTPKGKQKAFVAPGAAPEFVGEPEPPPAPTPNSAIAKIHADSKAGLISEEEAAIELNKIAQADKPTPYTDVAKAKADLDAGLITPEQFVSAANPNATNPATFANVTTARKELSASPGTHRYRIAAPTLSSMIKSTGDNTAMSDLDFIYGMAKIFDPDSAVREAEMVLVQNAQSLPEGAVGMIAKIMRGEAVLQPQARRDLVNVALNRAGEYRKQAEEEAKYFTDLAVRHQLDPKDIVTPLLALPAWPEEAAPAPGAPPAQQDLEAEMRRRGLL